MYRLIFRINCSRFFFFMKVHPYQTANCVLCDVIPLMIIAKICLWYILFPLLNIYHVLFTLIRWRISVLHFLFIYVWYWGGKTKELCNLDLKQQLKFDLMDSNFRNQGKIIVLPRPCLPWNQCRTRNVSLLAPMPSFSCETLTNSGISDVKHQRNWTKKKSTSRQLGTPRKTCSCHSWLPSKQPDQSKQGALLVFYSSII